MLNEFAHDHPTGAATAGLLLFVACGGCLDGVARRRGRRVAFALRCVTALLLAWPLYRLTGNGIASLMDHQYVDGGTGARALVAGVPLLLIILYIDNIVSIILPRSEGLVLSVLDRILGVGR